jgi:rod shape-determining protein MreD
MLLVAVAAGLAAGPDRGATLGFAAGISFDLLLQSPFGLSALTYALVAYVAGSLQDSVLRAAWWIPVTTAAAASALGVILYGVFGTVVGLDVLHLSLLRIAVVVGTLNALAAPVVLRAVRWATGTSESVRHRAVMR